MSLPDVSFTNNLGTLTFKRCLLGITDSWEYDGRVSRHVKSVSVSGYIQQGGIGEGYQGIITDRTADSKRWGDEGTLALPWGNLSRIRMTDFDIPSNVWLGFVPVQAHFADDYPDLNVYTMSYFGITVYNPRLSTSLPIRGLRDDYPLMQLTPGALSPFDYRNGVFRNRASQKNMDISLGGAIRINDNKLPTGLVAKLIQRSNMTPGVTGFTANLLPTGYPRIFNLGDAIPEVKNDLNLAQCCVVGATLTWHVEEQMADLSVQMMCPPQIFKRST